MLTEDIMTKDRVLQDLRHAVGEALRAERKDPDWEDSREYITTLGRELHRIGGIKAMDDALWHVVNQLPEPHAGRAMAIMDHRWNGIGTWIS